LQRAIAVSYSNQDLRTYDAAEKYCLVSATWFHFERRRAKIFEIVSSSGRFSVNKINAYLGTRGISSTRPDIDRALDHIFAKALTYPPGRFNDQSFPACYTAKELETCIEERRQELRSISSKGYDFVIFSVLFTGQLVDLRNTIRERRWEMPEDHGPCRALAEGVKKKYAGVATPSVHHVGGSCCVIFQRSCLAAGSIVDRGRLTP
jgi:RES domain